MPTQGGFFQAPVSKATVALTIGASVLSRVLHKEDVQLSMPALLNNLEAWRLVSSNFVFSDTGEMVIGGILLYTFRVFERILGSRKFGAFVILSTVLNTWIQLAILLVLHTGAVGQTGMRQKHRLFVSGPYGLIFSLFVLYYTYVPKLHPKFFSVFGMNFSDKSFYYLLGLQLAWQRKWQSAIPAIIGYFVGLLCQSKFLPFHKFMLPSAVEAFFKLFSPLFESSPPSVNRPRRRTPATAFGQAQQVTKARNKIPGGGTREQLLPDAGGFMGMQNNNGGMGEFQAPPPAPPPPAEAVESLVGMGFGRAEVLRALASSDNNLEIAANKLLSGS